MTKTALKAADHDVTFMIDTGRERVNREGRGGRGGPERLG